jgi:hypothetical protein
MRRIRLSSVACLALPYLHTLPYQITEYKTCLRYKNQPVDAVHGNNTCRSCRWGDCCLLKFNFDIAKSEYDNQTALTPTNVKEKEFLRQKVRVQKRDK